MSLPPGTDPPAGGNAEVSPRAAGDTAAPPPPIPPRTRDAHAPDCKRAPERSAGSRPPKAPGEHPRVARAPGGQRGCLGRPRRAGSAPRAPRGAAGPSPARRRGAAAGTCRPAALGARPAQSRGPRGFSLTSARRRLPRTPLPSPSAWLRRRQPPPPPPLPQGRKRPVPAPLRAWRVELRGPERGALGRPVPHLIPLAS